MANLKTYTDSSVTQPEPSLLVMTDRQRQSVVHMLDVSYRWGNKVGSDFDQSFEFRLAFDFDSKPGLKFLMQKISKSEMPSNLYQISSLVWSVRVVADVFLVSHAVADAGQDLSQCLTDLCRRYCEVVRTTETSEPSIDRISHHSLHLIQASHRELMDIIGKKSSDQTDNNNNEDSDEIDSQDDEDTEEELTENKEDVKVYNVVTQNRIDSMMNEYKKYKTQLSATPVIGAQRQSNDKPDVSASDSESNQFLIKVSAEFESSFIAIISAFIGQWGVQRCLQWNT